MSFSIFQVREYMRYHKKCLSQHVPQHDDGGGLVDGWENWTNLSFKSSILIYSKNLDLKL